jgi:hypothetical protein
MTIERPPTRTYTCESQPLPNTSHLAIGSSSTPSNSSETLKGRVENSAADIQLEALSLNLSVLELGRCVLDLSSFARFER